MRVKQYNQRSLCWLLVAVAIEAFVCGIGATVAVATYLWGDRW